jgi:hypothetical protein
MAESPSISGGPQALHVDSPDGDVARYNRNEHHHWAWIANDMSENIRLDSERGTSEV